MIWLDGFTISQAAELFEGIRKRLILTSKKLGINVIENGVYWQAAGPRLETKAEIRMMSQFADIVGMTMASEATIAAELELPYAAICSVDNYGHGLVEKPLIPEEIRKGARRNARNMLEIVDRYVNEFSFRHNASKSNAIDFIDMTISRMNNKKLTYKELIHG